MGLPDMSQIFTLPPQLFHLGDDIGIHGATKVHSQPLGTFKLGQRLSRSGDDTSESLGRERTAVGDTSTERDGAKVSVEHGDGSRTSFSAAAVRCPDVRLTERRGEKSVGPSVLCLLPVRPCRQPATFGRS
mmetsp:Transcript_479/g.1270  ORF Transcript_479/g.1270 Transcript_479/m.1270 type:complete len:131 (-) Transcript_479:621-1013(-)